MDIKELDLTITALVNDYMQFKLGYPGAIEKLMELNITNIHKRIDELEKENKMRQDAIACIGSAYNKACEDMEKRLDKLEAHFSGDYQLIASKLRPHKCPVCDFSGAIMLEGIDEVCRFGNDVMKTNDGKFFIWCKPCKGKGIVWG